MRQTAKTLSLVFGILLLSSSARAQASLPRETHNAALRYWMAFAQMQDPPNDNSLSELLEKTASGDTPWDEAKLAGIMNANEDAIRTMQRATKLPECDWGLEYSLGSQVPISFVYKARVLARLNTLYGMRVALQGDTHPAIDAWLAGIRFSQHVSNGGSLIFLLVARSALRSDLHALTQAARAGSLNEAERKQVDSAIRRLPETAFDWGSAWDMETALIDDAWRRISSSHDPKATYKELNSEPAPEGYVVPKASDLASFRTFMAQVAAALHRPPEVAEATLKTLAASEKGLNPWTQRVIPNFERVNHTRAEIKDDRQKLLEALASR